MEELSPTVSNSKFEERLKSTKLLSVCLSQAWNIIERRYVKDAKILFSMGIDVTYCVYPGSEVALRLNEIGIPFIRFKEEKSRNPFRANRQTVKQELREKENDILFIYGESSLDSLPRTFRGLFQGISFYLAGLDRTPLDYSKKKQGALKRIDVKLAISKHQKLTFESLSEGIGDSVYTGIGIAVKENPVVNTDSSTIGSVVRI